MRHYHSKLILISAIILILISCGKPNDSPKANANTGASPFNDKEAFLKSKYIQVFCKSSDDSSHSTSLDVYIASPQDSLETLSAHFTQTTISTPKTVESKTIENITRTSLDTIRNYSQTDYTLSIDLVPSSLPDNVKGSVKYLANNVLEEREVTCLVEELE